LVGIELLDFVVGEIAEAGEVLVAVARSGFGIEADETLRGAIPDSAVGGEGKGADAIEREWGGRLSE
jgi:hypothetical protein